MEVEGLGAPVALQGGAHATTYVLHECLPVRSRLAVLGVMGLAGLVLRLLAIALEHAAALDPLKGPGVPLAGEHSQPLGCAALVVGMLPVAHGIVPAFHECTCRTGGHEDCIFAL